MTPDDIRRERKRLGLTQQQLADAVKVTVKTVNRWEAKANPVTPHGEHLQRLQKVLGIPPAATLEQKLDAILRALGIDPAAV